MIRALFGILVLLPLAVIGLVVRFLATSRKAQALALFLILAACSGCAAILEHDARQCHREAVTVQAMTKCHEQFPQHNGTITDRIAQPLGELERKLF